MIPKLYILMTVSTFYTIPFDVEDIVDTQDNEEVDYTGNLSGNLKNQVKTVNGPFFIYLNGKV